MKTKKPVTESDYRVIDLFLDQTIEKTTNNKSETKLEPIRAPTNETLASNKKTKSQHDDQNQK